MPQTAGNCPWVSLQISTGFTLTMVQIQSWPVVSSLAAFWLLSPPLSPWPPDMTVSLQCEQRDMTCFVEMPIWYVGLWHEQMWTFQWCVLCCVFICVCAFSLSTHHSCCAASWLRRHWLSLRWANWPWHFPLSSPHLPAASAGPSVSCRATHKHN